MDRVRNFPTKGNGITTAFEPNEVVRPHDTRAPGRYCHDSIRPVRFRTRPGGSIGWGVGGVVKTALPAIQREALGALQTDGKLLVAVRTRSSATADFVSVLRYLPPLPPK